MYCRYCGRQVSDDARFCSSCGKRLREESIHVDPDSSSTPPPEPQKKAPNLHLPRPDMGKEAAALKRIPRSAIIIAAVAVIAAVGVGIGVHSASSRGAAHSNTVSHTAGSGSRSTASKPPEASKTPTENNTSTANPPDDFWGEDEIYAWYPSHECFFGLDMPYAMEPASGENSSAAYYEFPYSVADAEKLFAQYRSVSQEHFVVSTVSDKFPRLGINYKSADDTNSGAVTLYYSESSRSLCVSLFWLEQDDGDKSLHDVWRAKADFSGITPLDSSAAPETTATPKLSESSKPTATPKPAASLKKTGVIPDFEAFSGITLKNYGITEYSTYTKLSYGFDKNEKFTDEYMALLEDYGFVLRDSFSSSISSTYVYDYSGKGGGTFTEDVKNVNSDNIALWIHLYKTNSCQMDIMYADGFTVKDTGERTTRTVTMERFSDVGGSSSSDSDYSPNVAGFAKQDCLKCGGSGKCPSCGGYGYVYSSASHRNDRNCSDCRTSGRCSACGGSGKR